MHTKKLLSLVLLLPILCWLPGCGKKGEVNESCPGCAAASGSHKPVVKVDGKVVADENDIAEAIKALECQQPMFKQILGMMPADQKRQIFEQLVNGFADQSLIEDYVIAQKWDRDECYQRVAKQMHKYLDRELAGREYRKRIIESIAAQITDKEAEEFYMSNRESNNVFRMPPYLSSMGGTEAVAVKLNTDAEAKAFAAKARAAGDLRRAASDAKLAVMDLGLVSVQTLPMLQQFDPMIIRNVMELKSVPSFNVVAAADKKAFYVVHAVRKLDAQYAAYAEVAPQVKELMANERFPQAFKVQMDGLKAAHKVEIEKEFIDKMVGETAPKAEQPAA